MLPVVTSGMVKTLAMTLSAVGFFNEFFEGLSSERNDGSVGMDGPSLNVFDRVSAKSSVVMETGVAKFNVAEVLTSVGEDFEADVDAELVRPVFGSLLTIEVDCSCAGNLRLQCHREFFRGRWRPLTISVTRREPREKAKEGDTKETTSRRCHLRLVPRCTWFGSGGEDYVFLILGFYFGVEAAQVRILLHVEEDISETERAVYGEGVGGGLGGEAVGD